MAKRKVEIALQQEINTQDEWNAMLNKEGLIVVDVYQQWSGTCKAIEGTFRKIKLELVVDCYQDYGGPVRALEPRLRTLKNFLGDNKLHFAIAKADTIESLEDYRGRCEPCFLFYAAKQLVQVIRGANAPLITKTIQEQLAYEHKCLKGEAQRKPIKDPFLVNLKKQKDHEESKAQVDHLMNANKQVTICIIKPDIIQKNKKDEVLQKIKEKGYEIIEQKELTMTEEQAREFYKHKASSPQFEDLIKYMISSPSCILALSKGDTGENVIEDLRHDIGATDPNKAKQENPDSIRALYGTDNIVNSVHASDSKETAAKELAFFFPNFMAPQIPGKSVQRTLALIRPSAYQANKDEIIKKIQGSGFNIAMKKVVQLTKEQAEQFYAEHKGKMFFDDLVNEMSSGPMMVLCLVKDDAINAWRAMLGPKEKDKVKETTGTLRNEFDVTKSPVNALHGASTPQQAEKELNFFFPMEQTIALIKPGLADDKRREIEKKIEDSGFIVAAKKQQKLTADLAKNIYKDATNKPYFNDLVNLMTKDDVEVFVLSRQNAIDGWREMIGNVDPTKARTEHPNSLRAIFGEDILNNAVHGPSNKSQVEHEIKVLFGDAKFDDKVHLNFTQSLQSINLISKSSFVDKTSFKLAQNNILESYANFTPKILSRKVIELAEENNEVKVTNSRDFSHKIHKKLKRVKSKNSSKRHKNDGSSKSYLNSSSTLFDKINSEDNVMNISSQSTDDNINYLDNSSSYISSEKISSHNRSFYQKTTDDANFKEEDSYNEDSIDDLTSSVPETNQSEPVHVNFVENDKSFETI